MKFQISEPLKEALLELLRVILLSIVPLAIIQLESGELDYQLLAVTGVIAGLRFVDKLLHEVGKTRENSKLKKGLTRF